jgi:urea transport system permease protein
MCCLRGLASLLALVLAFGAAAARAAGFEDLVKALPGASFSDKAALVEQIAGSGHPRAGTVLAALMDGSLFQVKSERRVVIAADGSGGLEAIDAVSGESVGSLAKGALTKVRSNNNLRKAIRGAIAGLDLSHPDPARRMAAASELLGSPSESSTRRLRAALAKESEPEVRDAIRLGLATIDIHSPVQRTRLGAINELSDSLRQEVLGVLRAVAGDETERDAEVKAAARDAARGIESRLRLYAQIENLFFGLSLGSVLLLAAIGLAVTFGVMGVINMAHGEMVMIGAYTTYVVQTLMPDLIDYSLVVAIPAAFVITALVGVLMERGVIRFLYGRPLETLLATFGVSLILQQAVRSVFSPLNRSVSTPDWMSGAMQINPALSLTYNRLFIIVFALLVLAGLALVLKRTRFGLEVRAVTQNRGMAKAMGIRTGRVDAMTFGLGSGIAGMAGVALSQLTNVGPNMGQAYIVDSFMVVVFGGVGNLLGTFVGAMSLGVANKFLEPVTGTVLAKILILVLIIAFIQRRPQGLFALGGRAAE